MFSTSKITALYCIIDDLLKALGHRQDKRVRVSDAEVITTAFVSVLYFGGHWDHARCFMKLKGYVPFMLDKSRFCRRLHRLSDVLLALFYQMGQHIKDMAGASEYLLDSFPVAVCDNVRIRRCKLLKGKYFHGKHSAMGRYFYGVRVQLLTIQGIPVEFVLVPGAENDSVSLRKLPLQVCPESSIYMDAGYTDYRAEDDAFDAEAIVLKVGRKSNAKRKDPPYAAYIKQRLRKNIESTISVLKSKMLRHIHAVTTEGFLLKVALFVIAYQIDKITN
jgi:Transposase DDE domain